MENRLMPETRPSMQSWGGNPNGLLRQLSSHSGAFAQGNMSHGQNQQTKLEPWQRAQLQARLLSYPTRRLSMTERVSSPQTPGTDDSGGMYGDFSSSLPLLANLASQLPHQPAISPESSSSPVDTNSSNGEFTTQKGRPVKPKRAQVKNACVHCQKACKKCSQERPCERCTKYGYTDCVDSPRKPRQRGIKRGPYKRKSSYSAAINNFSPWSPFQHGSQPGGEAQAAHAFQKLPNFNGMGTRQATQTYIGPQAEHPAPHTSTLGGQTQAAPKWANRDLQLQAHIASLPLATPLKGSPTATPASGQMFTGRHVGLTHQLTEYNVHANMQGQSQPSSGTCTPSNPQTLAAAGFANHAQLLRAKLSPLVTGEAMGLSRAMEHPTVSSVPGTAFSGGDTDRSFCATRLPFMGHAATAPSSPTGMRAFFEIEDMWKEQHKGRVDA